jgi:hypothetical protein
MSLILQCPAKKMRFSAGFHADQFHLQVRRKVQRLLARALLAHYKLAAQVRPTTGFIQTM